MTTVETHHPAGVLARLAQRRRSCRRFRAEPVPREVLLQVLEIARHSPSWCNTQPWEVVVTEGAATERLRDALRGRAPAEPDLPFPERYTGVHAERRRECAWQLYDSVGIARDDRAASAAQTMENFTFFGAPHVLVLTTARALGVYGVLDCGVWLGHLLLAAEGLGLAAIPQAALALHSAVLQEQLSLGEDRQVVCGVSLGWADDEHPANGFRTHRASVEDMARFRAE